MVGGLATRADYAAFLVQMAALHAILEPALQGCVAEVPALKDVVRPYHFRQAAAGADLRALGHLPELDAPLPATARFCEQMNDSARRDPLSLLGILYVLEGATNGGKFIAAALRPALALPDGIGTAYLDPHGPHQSERWAQFRTSVDMQSLNETERTAVIDAACDTFKAICDILEELHAPRATQEA